MLLIRANAGPSLIHGTGVFLAEAVRRGQPVWRFQPGFDQLISPAEFPKLPDLARAFLHFYAYLDRDSGSYVLNGDHARFMNHAETPNTGMPETSSGEFHYRRDGETVALTDLAAGTELTCDYRQFDAEYARKFGLTG